MLYHEANESTPTAELASLVARRPLPGEQWPRGFHQWGNVQDAHAVAMRRASVQLRHPPHRKEGTGVVVYGGGRYLPSAYVTVRAIRHCGYAGPIELFHLDGPEMDAFHERLFSRMGVEVLDASRFPERRDRRLFGGWPMKPFALQHSRFRHVRAFDADCYPAGRDVLKLIDDSPQYAKAGAFFLSDQASFDLKDEVWEALRMHPQKCWSFESGFMAIDTVRHWRELALAQWLNDHHDYYYHHFWGDKETYAVAWRYLNGDYFQTDKRWCKVDHSLVHYWTDDRPLVVHRCEDKFTTVTDREGMTLFWNTKQRSGANRLCPHLPLEMRCFGWLNDYRTQLEAAGGSHALAIKTGVEGFAIIKRSPLRHPVADRTHRRADAEVYRP